MKIINTDNGQLRLPYILPGEAELKKMADQFAHINLFEREAESKEYVLKNRVSA